MRDRAMIKLISGLVLAVLITMTVLWLPQSPSRAETATALNVAFSLTRLTDNAAEDTNPTVAVDSNNKAHVVYERDGDVYYATDAGGSWGTEPVPTDAADAYRPTIAIDGSDHARVAYFSGAPPTLDIYHATNATGTWTAEQVGDTDMPATWNLHLGLALDNADRAYIVYHRYDSSGPDHEIEIRYQEDVRRQAPTGGWVTQPVTEDGVDDMYPSIAVDGTGAIHVAYQSTDAASGDFYPDLRHATYSGGAWSFVKVTQTPWKGDENPSLALDGNDQAHVVWQVSDAGSFPSILYGDRTTGGWITTTLTANRDNDLHPALAMDNGDKAHVVYQNHDDTGTVHIRYANNAAGEWMTGTVASDPTNTISLAGNDRAVGVDRAGYVHVVYSMSDGNDQEIWYARSDQPVVPPANQPPNPPTHPVPSDGATDVGIDDNILSWLGGDPDGADTVTYDVYFGTANPLPLVRSGWPTTSLTVTLASNTQYMWQVVARDNHGAETTGPVWTFTTGDHQDVHVIYIPCIARAQ